MCRCAQLIIVTPILVKTLVIVIINSSTSYQYITTPEFYSEILDWSPGIHLQESESVSQPSLYPSIQSSFHIYSLISPSHSHPRVFSSRWRGRWWCCGESWRGETRLFGASPPPWPSSPPEWRIWKSHLQSDLTESVCILYMHSLCCVYNIIYM